MTTTVNNSITLTSEGLKFATGFTTLVTKVITVESKSSIVLDSLPHVQISLGDQSAEELNLEKGTSVTIEPIKDSLDGSFTLTVGNKAQAPAPTKTPTRGSSPLPGMSFSNVLE